MLKSPTTQKIEFVQKCAPKCVENDLLHTFEHIFVFDVQCAHSYFLWKTIVRIRESRSFTCDVFKCMQVNGIPIYIYFTFPSLNQYIR